MVGEEKEEEFFHNHFIPPNSGNVSFFNSSEWNVYHIFGMIKKYIMIKLLKFHSINGRV